MAVLAELAGGLAALGPTILAARGGWHAACYGYGSLLAAQQGVDATEDQAYHMGRTRIMQGLAEGFVSAAKSIDWKVVAETAKHTRDNLHTARLAVWRGLKGDAARLLEAIRVRRKDGRSPEVKDIHEGLLRANALMESDPHAASKARADHIIDAQVRIAALTNSDKPLSVAQVRELEDLHGIVKEWRGHIASLADPEKKIAPLFAVPSAGGLIGGIGAIAILGALGIGALAVEEFRIGHIKHQSVRDREALKSLVVSYDALTKNVGTLRVQVQQQNVTCIQETKAAADRRTAQDARTRAVQLKARMKLDAASRGDTVPFDLTNRLRELDAAPGAASGARGADGVAGGVPGASAAITDPASAPSTPVASEPHPAT